VWLELILFETCRGSRKNAARIEIVCHFAPLPPPPPNRTHENLGAQHVERVGDNELKRHIHADQGEDDPNAVAAANPAHDFSDGETAVAAVEEE
jgi:Icc-related predicted phosphoesterase